MIVCIQARDLDLCKILVIFNGSKLGNFCFRCGYVLQPECMRNEDYSPFDKKSIRVDPLTISINVSNLYTCTLLQ